MSAAGKGERGKDEEEQQTHCKGNTALPPLLKTDIAREGTVKKLQSINVGMPSGCGGRGRGKDEEERRMHCKGDAAPPDVARDVAATATAVAMILQAALAIKKYLTIN
jgi:hypothetical protein